MSVFIRLVVCKEMVKRGERRSSANKRFALGSRREEPRSFSGALLIYVRNALGNTKIVHRFSTKRRNPGSMLTQRLTGVFEAYITEHACDVK